MAGIGLALLAGVLTSLSPCVLPLVPIVIATALGEHRLGPVALAGGLALSFVIIGLFVATVGFAAGLDQELFRVVAAVLLILTWRRVADAAPATAARRRRGPDRELDAGAQQRPV